MADAREVNDALVRVARAMQRGTLPLQLHVRNNAGIGLELWPGPMSNEDESRETERRIMVWLQRYWPEGMTMERIERTWSSQARRRPKRWWDRRSWQSSNDPHHAAVIHFSYSVPHLCREWVTRFGSPEWQVRWHCGACGKLLTKTQARAAGLVVQ